MEKERRTEKQEHEEKHGSRKSEVLEYVRLIAIVVGVTIFLEAFIIVNAVIPSASMEPTIMTGDHIFGNRLAYRISDPERYDIIIFRYPDDEKQLFIKRVIGLPGDKVEFRDGDVYVNDESVPLRDDFCSVQDQTVIDLSRTQLTNSFIVPEDAYFVLGDNRLNSRDSRYWNEPFVHRDKILGEAMFRYWPLNKIGVIHRLTEEEG